MDHSGLVDHDNLALWAVEITGPRLSGDWQLKVQGNGSFEPKAENESKVRTSDSRVRIGSWAKQSKSAESDNAHEVKAEVTTERLSLSGSHSNSPSYCDRASVSSISVG